MSENTVIGAIPTAEIETTENRTIDELFKGNLPSNLWFNHYDLASIYRQYGYTPEEWRLYIRTQDRFIMNEISAITEASSRQALQKLASGEATTGDVSAIRQLLERSEQINQATQSTKTFVIAQFDHKTKEPPKKAGNLIGQHILKHKKEVSLLYNHADEAEVRKFQRREMAGEIEHNRDGTLHFPKQSAINEWDRAYLRLFNPDNIQVHDLPYYEDEGDGDVQ